MSKGTISDKDISLFQSWQQDWNRFVRDVLKARLDKEQQDIVTSVQFNKMTSVASGTARGKDFVAACCSLSFLYLTPSFNKEGIMTGNTKVAMTAPTARQVHNIMTPEVRRLFNSAKVLPGRLVADDIRTDNAEWFLTGFKAGDDATESWSGFHAVNTMFVVTEASGISEITFNAIEGNLQGNSRLLLVFNPNVTGGYAANSMKSPRFAKFRLNSLNAENVVKKKIVIPGQVDYDWVFDKVQNWCVPIQQTDFNAGEGDFVFENGLYRPNDLFRVKVLGMFPKVSEDVLIPLEWIELANQRWHLYNETGSIPMGQKRRGCDVAGMGRDSSVMCDRIDNYVFSIEAHQSGGKADHMHVAGMISNAIDNNETMLAFIDTIGEGAGVYSRLVELGYDRNVISAKVGNGASGLHDITGQYTFSNMRAYIYWALRDWLDPKNGYNPCLPPDDLIAQELTDTHWFFQSDGSIAIEKKDDIKKRLKRSPDRADALALTFWPVVRLPEEDDEILEEIL